MSQILHSSDYMTIFGDLKDINSEKYLYLAFSIQVNGKTKAFSFHFRLIEQKDKKEDETGYLKEYREWYNIYELLWNIGYPIGDYSPDNPMGWNIINEWVEELVQSYDETDVFYR